MKLTIEVPNIELFAKAFNNAVATCGNIYWSVCAGCEVPSNFEALKTIPEEELMARIKCLKGVYKQIEEIEKTHKGEQL